MAYPFSRNSVVGRPHSHFLSVANTQSDHTSSCDDKLYSLCQSQSAVMAAFQSLGLLVHLQQEISQLACVFSSTTSAPASILGKLNTDKKELAAVEVLLLKCRMFYELWPGMYCFNNTESFPSPRTAGSCPRGDQWNPSLLPAWGWPKWFSWLLPFLGPLAVIPTLIWPLPCSFRFLVNSIYYLTHCYALSNALGEFTEKGGPMQVSGHFPPSYSLHSVSWELCLISWKVTPLLPGLLLTRCFCSDALFVFNKPSLPEDLSAGLHHQWPGCGGAHP